MNKRGIGRYWFESIQSLLDEGVETPFEFDVEDLRLVKLLCEQIEKGETDILAILKRRTDTWNERQSHGSQ